MNFKGLAVSLICGAATLSMSSFARADGVVARGDAYCGSDQVIVHGSREIRVEKGMDGLVDLNDPSVLWSCHNANRAGDFDARIDCPPQTNRFLVHRQKPDNAQWLYECRVRSFSIMKKKTKAN